MDKSSWFCYSLLLVYTCGTKTHNWGRVKREESFTNQCRSDCSQYVQVPCLLIAKTWKTNWFEFGAELPSVIPSFKFWFRMCTLCIISNFPNGRLGYSLDQKMSSLSGWSTMYKLRNVMKNIVRNSSSWEYAFVSICPLPFVLIGKGSKILDMILMSPTQSHQLPGTLKPKEIPRNLCFQGQFFNWRDSSLLEWLKCRIILCFKSDFALSGRILVLPINP